ncbi:MAG: ParA family protein [Nitrospirae bacterium]|nr:ParA family protein [Nitrospirota bacterium]
MGHVISVSNQKGGVGKTTSAVNLAASLAVAGYRTLLIDMDPQGNATSGVGVNARACRHTVYDVLMRGADLDLVACATEMERLAVAPSHVDLVGAEVELVNEAGRELRLKEAIGRVRDRYDYILLDCPPSLGIVTLNALTAADSVVVPVQCEYYALEGLGQLTKTIDLVRRHLNPQLALLGVLLTMADRRNNLCRQVMTEVRRHFGAKVFEAVIPRNITLAEAPSHGRPILLYNIASNGAQAYLALAGEIVARTGARPALSHAAR